MQRANTITQPLLTTELFPLLKKNLKVGLDRMKTHK